MKANYKNWVPKKFIFSVLAGALISAFLFILFGNNVFKNININYILRIISFIAFIFFGVTTIWCIYAYNKFSYNGSRKLSKEIIEGISDYIKIKDGGVGLDVGCGSGALTISVAKKNPRASLIGIDRWGREYSSFNKKLCEENAEIENVSNVKFQRGNALKLDFPDEYFDAVMSNYVYHNISGIDKKDLLLETLRVLKKGGTFAIHDPMTKERYGDINDFVEKLKSMGYEKVELIDTDNGKFMTKGEAKLLFLKGSKLLVGIK